MRMYNYSKEVINLNYHYYADFYKFMPIWPIGYHYYV